jgi:hypothetical protein
MRWAWSQRARSTGHATEDTRGTTPAGPARLRHHHHILSRREVSSSTVHGSHALLLSGLRPPPLYKGTGGSHCSPGEKPPAPTPHPTAPPTITKHTRTSQPSIPQPTATPTTSPARFSDLSPNTQTHTTEHAPTPPRRQQVCSLTPLHLLQDLPWFAIRSNQESVSWKFSFFFFFAWFACKVLLFLVHLASARKNRDPEVIFSSLDSSCSVFF